MRQFFRFVYLSALVLLANHSDTLAGEITNATSKCGRDAAFWALQDLGINASIKQLDISLGMRDIVSVNELQRVIEDFGVDTKLRALTTANALEVRDYMQSHMDSISVIVAVPPQTGELYHFAPLSRIEPEGVIFVDLAKNEEMMIPFWRVLKDDQIPILIVSKPSSLTSWLWSLSMLVISSPWTLASVCIGLLFLAVPASCRQHLAKWRSPRIAISSVCTTLVVGLLAVGYFAFPVASSPWTLSGQVQDLGVLPIGSQHTAVIEIDNKGPTPLDIATKEVSCSCVGVRPESLQVAPGSTGTLEVDVEVSSVGKSRQHILIKLEDGIGNLSEEVIQLAYTGNTSGAIEPLATNVGVLPKGMPVTRTVHFKLAGFNSNSEFRVSVNSAIEDDDCLKITMPENFTSRSGEPIPIEVASKGNFAVGPLMQRINFTLQEVGTERQTVIGCTLHAEVVHPLQILPELPEKQGGPEAEFLISCVEGGEQLLHDFQVRVNGKELDVVNRTSTAQGVIVRLPFPQGQKGSKFILCTPDGDPLSQPYFATRTSLKSS